ncbi:MAG: choice-of-anchor J domain-containing protein [candidate division WOR-3 bacterium]|nr:choice-of-anchor J domain-containing protein [candidate division WOR-3 bacterium]
MKVSLTTLLLCLCSAAAYATLSQDTVYYCDFEAGWSGWYPENGVWQWGHPDSGPGGAHGGQNCVGTILNGHTPDIDDRLISPEISIPAYNPDRKLRLRFFGWFSFGYLSSGKVQISVSNGPWYDLSYSCSESGPWAEPQVDITQYQGKSVRFGFFFTGSGNPDWGWYFDDVAVVSSTFTDFHNPEDFEQGWGDWWTQRGYWEIGHPLGGPNQPPSGENCVCTLLGGYPPDQDSRLVSARVFLPDTVGGQSIRLSFYHWFQFPYLAYGSVQVSVNGTSWTTLSQYEGSSGGNWLRPNLDITAYAGRNIYLGFLYEGSGNSGWGWAVDSLSIDGMTAHDVMTTEILVPADTVDSGTVVVPSAVVENAGMGTETFDTRFRIASYAEAANVTLPAGHRETLSFIPWEATEIGQQAASCSTELATDQKPDNDRLAKTIFVRTLDVGVSGVAGFGDTMYSGGGISPTATVGNLGNTTVSFMASFAFVRMDSPPGPVSLDSTQITLPPYVDTVVSFQSWTAVEGSYQAVARASLAGDMQSSNDSMARPFVVVRLPHDVGTAGIAAPTDTVDSGTTLSPSVVVANYGSSAETFPVEVRIPSTYVDTQTTTLEVGKSDTISLRALTFETPGPVTVVCTTKLAGDMNPSNDRRTGVTFVRVTDAGVTAIIAPVDTMDAGTVVPCVRVRNYGNLPAVVRTVCRIDDFLGQEGSFVDTLDTTIAAREEESLAFAAWRADPGSYRVNSWTELAGDQHPDNDSAGGGFVVRRLPHDVGVVRIVSPTGEADSGALPASAVVMNYGTSTESFFVRLGVGADYRDSVSVSGLAPGETALAGFRDWSPSTFGVFPVCCTTMLAQDMNPGNDMVRDSVVVRRLDVGVTQIIAPAGSLSPGEVIPAVTVKNFGSTTASFPVTFTIEAATLAGSGRSMKRLVPANLPRGLSGSGRWHRTTSTAVYTDSAQVTDLMPGDSCQVTFAAWQATGGSYVAGSWTALAGDRDLGNDTAARSFSVAAAARYWALLAGVESYQSLPARDYAAADIQGMRGALLKYDNWQDSSVVSILNSEATKAGIKSKLDSLGCLMTSDDTFLFYFSGRGARGPDVDPIDETDGQDEYLCPYDAASGELGNAIRDDELTGWLSALPTRNVCSMMDADFAGGVAEDVVGPGAVALACCRASDSSVGATARLQHNLFSYNLIGGLGQRPAGEAGLITAGALFAYADSATKRMGALLARNVLPVIYDSCPGGFVLCRRKIAPASNLSAAYCYPNPFRPDLGHSHVTFTNLTAGFRLRIVDASGYVVLDRDVTPNTNGTYVWDVKNHAGLDVPSGVLVYVLSNEAGNVRTGRLAIVR